MSASFMRIGGEPFVKALFSSVAITQELNRHWWCRLRFRQTADARFPIEEILGQDLQVGGVDERGVEEVIFDGFVLEADLEYEVYGSYTVRLVAVSRSYRLDLAPRQAYYLKKTLGEIAGSLAGPATVEQQVAVSKQPPRNYVQWGETDFSFLRRLADDHRSWLRPTAQGIEIRDNFPSGAKVCWRGSTQEDTLVSFRIHGKLAPPAFDGTHYDFLEMESKTYTGVREQPEFLGSISGLVGAVESESQDLPNGYQYERRRAPTLEDFENTLKEESARAIGGNICGRGISRNPRLQPGDTVEVEGLEGAEGVYGLTKVVHRWDQVGYLNEFWCTPWKHYHGQRRRKSRCQPGVAPARVEKNDDPERLGRVCVKFIWQEDGITDWIRVITPHAGPDRGFYFVPEIGDEVLVAFEDGDPERPVVLGSQWNGLSRPQAEDFWGEEHAADDVKRIVTKSGHRIHIVDQEEKESIVLATPRNLRISMVAKTDETENPAITLFSKTGDIFLSAPNGRIHFRSKFFTREIGEDPEFPASPTGP